MTLAGSAQVMHVYAEACFMMDFAWWAAVLRPGPMAKPEGVNTSMNVKRSCIVARLLGAGLACPL